MKRAISSLLAFAVIAFLLLHFHPWESNEARGKRLETAKVVACFEAENAARVGMDPATAQVHCDQATHAYDKFIAGDWF